MSSSLNACPWKYTHVRLTVSRSSIVTPPPLPPTWFRNSPQIILHSSILVPHFLSPPIRPTTVVAPPRAVVSGDGAFLRDAGVTGLVLVGGYGLVSAFDYLTLNNFIPQIASSFIATLCSCVGKLEPSDCVLWNIMFEFEQEASPYLIWALFHGVLASIQNSTSTDARYFASLVPLANGLRLLVYGLSLVTDKGLVKSVTREGKPEELLRGPLYYVLILALCAVVFWRESPVGLISLSMMSGGDGVADIMGRKFGTVKIPYNKKKSWAGSISMFAFGFLTSLAMLYYFSSLGYFQLDWISTMQRVAVISFLASFVESLPTEGLIDDNLSVPLLTMIAAYLCFSL